MTTRLKFQFNDGGRAKAGYSGSTGDCVTRAVAIATGRPYQEIYDVLSRGCRNERKSTKGSARNGVHVKRKWFKNYMASIGWVFVPTMSIGSGCTVHLAEGELPNGRIIASVSKHYCAVIDGVIQDTHDPNDRGVTIYPPQTPPDEIPKNAKWLSNGNGWAYAPLRCVYGYWIVASRAS